MAWLLVGIGVFVAGMIWILGLTEVIVAPLIAASVIAAVASPLVAWLARHRVPRSLGAVLVLLLIVAAGVGMTVMVVTGITGQGSEHHLAGRQRQGHDRRLAPGPRARPEQVGAGAGGRNQRDHRQRGRAPQRDRDRDREALLTRVLPRADRTQPLLPAQRWAEDPRLGGRPHGRAARRRAGDHPAGPGVVARLLPGGDNRRRIQRRRGHGRGVDPGRAAGRDDRRGHLHRRLHPLPRRLGRGRVRGPAGARRRRGRCRRRG